MKKYFTLFSAALIAASASAADSYVPAAPTDIYYQTNLVSESSQTDPETGEYIKIVRDYGFIEFTVPNTYADGHAGTISASKLEYRILLEGEDNPFIFQYVEASEDHGEYYVKFKQLGLDPKEWVADNWTENYDFTSYSKDNAGDPTRHRIYLYGVPAGLTRIGVQSRYVRNSSNIFESEVTWATPTVPPEAQQPGENPGENPIDDVVITDVPETAVPTVYCRNSVGLQMGYLGSWENTELNGWAQEIWEDGDAVYMSDPLSALMTGTYLKGTKTEFGYSFPLPQRLFDYDENGKQETFYVDMFYFDPISGEYFRDEEEGRSYDLELLPNGQYKFDYLGVNSESSMFGTYFYTDRLLGLVEGSTGDWMGYGEEACRLIPFDPTLVVAPAGLATKDYQFTYDSNGYIVKIGTDGNDFYIQGLLQDEPDNWVKGSITDGYVSIPEGQYLGMGEGRTVFFAGAELVEGNYGTEPMPRTFTMTYDPASDIYTAAELLWLSDTPELDGTYQIFDKVVFRPMPSNLNPTPEAPKIVSFSEYDDFFEECNIMFSVSGLNVDGDVLNMNRMEFALFLDGELYTFDPDYFTYLSEEMEWVPVGFTENHDFYYYGDGNYSIYFFHPFENSVAVQTRYLDDKGAYHYSKKTTAYTHGSVEGIDNSLDVVEEVAYDLTGRRIMPGQPGFSVRVLTLSDGSTRTIKSVRTH